MLKRLEENDGRSHAAEKLRTFKWQKHIYENYGGGRALMGGSQGLVLVDARKRWLEERAQLGEFQIASDEIRQILDSYWTIESHPGSKRIEEAAVRSIFDNTSASKTSSTLRPSNRENGAAKGTNNDPKTIVITEVFINESSRMFPSERVAGLVSAIKNKSEVSEAVEELRRITGLDFGGGSIRALDRLGSNGGSTKRPASKTPETEFDSSSSPG
jgi:hypothetical protein